MDHLRPGYYKTRKKKQAGLKQETDCPFVPFMFGPLRHTFKSFILKCAELVLNFLVFIFDFNFFRIFERLIVNYECYF